MGFPELKELYKVMLVDPVKLLKESGQAIFFLFMLLLLAAYCVEWPEPTPTTPSMTAIRSNTP